MNNELWAAAHEIVFYILLAAAITQGGLWLVRRFRSYWLDRHMDAVFRELQDAPDERVYQFGRWLGRVLHSKTGHPVDTDAGFKEFNLWAKYKGTEFHIAITLSKTKERKL